MDGRVACCEVTGSRCGTRFSVLRAWVTKTTGKGVKVVHLSGDAQGKAPFHAQPVGYDGRAFYVAFDHGCDTEKLLHEVCHWWCAPRARRTKPNYGLGPAGREVDDPTGDNEEVTVMLLERLLAPEFGLPLERIARPDYNVVSRRNVDWDACEARAGELYASLPPRPASG
ncbi:MAG: hypothetical protein JNL79_39750 [Myxococcales bacterium]|nr:hypothetical protein [Myxococcales bacterium]